MSDSSFQLGPVDPARVDLTEAHEFRFWTTRFACTPQQLIDALGSAGVDAAAVGSHLAIARAAETDAESSQARRDTALR